MQGSTICLAPDQIHPKWRQVPQLFCWHLGYKTPNYIIVKSDKTNYNITIESGDYVFVIDGEPYDAEMQEMVQELKDILKSNKNGVEIFDEHPSDEYWE